jgi:hypothetical protein
MKFSLPFRNHLGISSMLRIGRGLDGAALFRTPLAKTGKWLSTGTSSNRLGTKQRWLAEYLPKLVITAGLLLFALTCIEFERLPTETIFVGPAVMFVGIFQLMRNRRD